MRIAMLAVPYDAGRRSMGVGLGPARLLDFGIARELSAAGHSVRQAMVEVPDATPPHELARTAAAQRELARLVHDAVRDGEFPLVLAGNCSTAVGTLAARPPGTAVVWFDAHADLNTAATTTTGMVDGMALSMVTGREFAGLTASVDGFTPVNESQIVLVGVRDLDPAEEALLGQSPVHRLAADEAPARIGATIRQLGQPVPPVYVHLDLDVLDPAEARANQYGAPRGMSVSALGKTLAAIARTAPVFAVAITAYDPWWDKDGRARQAAVAVLKEILPPGDGSE